MQHMPSIQKAKRVVNLMTIDVGSLKFVKVGSSGTTFALTFTYDARSDGTLFLYFVGKRKRLRFTF